MQTIGFQILEIAQHLNNKQDWLNQYLHIDNHATTAGNFQMAYMHTSHYIAFS